MKIFLNVKVLAMKRVRLYKRPQVLTGDALRRYGERGSFGGGAPLSPFHNMHESCPIHVLSEARCNAIQYGKQKQILFCIIFSYKGRIVVGRQDV